MWSWFTQKLTDNQSIIGQKFVDMKVGYRLCFTFVGFFWLYLSALSISIRRCWFGKENKSYIQCTSNWLSGSWKRTQIYIGLGLGLSFWRYFQIWTSKQTFYKNALICHITAQINPISCLLPLLPSFALILRKKWIISTISKFKYRQWRLNEEEHFEDCHGCYFILCYLLLFFLSH